MGVHDLSRGELVRLYGPWARRTPDEAAELFADYPGIWWITGGWAIEAYTGSPRFHGDLDIGVPRVELTLLRRHLAGRLDVWTATDGALCPLLPDTDPAASPDEILPVGCHQLWTRQSALDPWEYDIQLVATDGDDWIYRRDPTIRMPLDAALWTKEGKRYLRAEIQLLYKAKGLRDKDMRDFTATLPHLEESRRAWLRTALLRTIPGHPWLEQI